MKLKAYTVNDLNNIGEIITISHDSVDGNNNSLKTFKTNNTIYILNDVVNKISDNNPLYTPIVDSVSPNFTSYDTGVLVRVKGKNLSNLKSIKIQDIDVKIETFNIISDEIIDVIFPPISQSYPNNNPFVAGLKSILFTFNTEFTIVLENAFTYYLPAAVINQSAICPGGGTLCNGVGVYNNGQLDTRGIIIQWQCSDCATCNFTQPRYAKIYRDNKLIATTESGAVEYVDRTYTPGILHSYTIKCILPQGNISSFTSAPVVLVYPLSKPIGVIASDRLYTNKIKITWNRFVNWGPYVDGGEGFNIYRNGSTTKLNSSPITTLEYNDFDSALIPETAYTYRVQTVTGIYVSSLSDSATGYKLLGPPSSIEASNGLYPDKVKIEWGALPNVTNYKVYREGTLIHTETSANFYYDTTGALNTEYLYGVSSVLGSKESTIITDVGFSYIIVKPVINSATLDGASGNITISWQLFSGADSYYLYRDGVLLTSFINSPTTQTYTDTTTKTGKCYSYTLKAESNSVMSALSDAKNLCVPLNAPVNLTASTTDSTQITLTWSAPTPLKLPVGVGVTYHVYRNNSLLEILLQNDVLTYDDLSAAIGVNYTYKIKAEIIIDSVSTLSDFSNTSVGIRPGQPIPLPSNVSATDGTNINNITVTWDAPGVVTSYTIWREVSVGGVWSTPQNIGNQDYSASVVLTTKTDSLGSSPLTEYYKQYRYSVVANDSGSGTSSDYSLTDTGYLKPIIGSFSISASTIYDFKIAISWSAVTGTEGYEIWRSTSAGGSYTKIGTSPTTNYDDTDSSLIPNTSYYYKVKTIFFTTTSDLSTQYATGIKIPVAPKIPVIDSIKDIYYLAPLQYGECCQSDRTGSLYRIKFIGTNLNEITKIYFGTVLSVFDHINTTDGSYIYRIPQQQGTDKTVNIYIKYGTPEQTITWPTPFTYFGAPVIDTPSPALIINDWNQTYTITGTDLQPLADAGRIFTITKLELFSELNPSNTYDLMGQIGSSTNNSIQISDVPFMNDWSINPGTGLIGLRIETFLDIGSYGSFTFSTTKNNYLEYQNAIPKQPTITNVIPSFGQNIKIPLSDFIITGTNFDYVDGVYFVDSTPSKNEYFVSFTKNSDTQITVLAANFPNFAFWSNQFWAIKVRTSYQGTLLYTTYPNAYRFIGTPTITSPTGVIPKYVSTVTPTPITITGTNFIELNSAVSDNNVTLKVSIQAITPYAAVVMTGITITPDSPITTASNTSITTTVPAISGQPHGQKRSLLIEEDYSKASVSTPTIAAINSIIYCQPPTVSFYTPSSGTTSTSVTITGTNFLANGVNISTVKFGTTTASFTGTPSNTSLTVLAPALSGVQTITLETPGGTVTVGSFTYNTSLSIDNVTPNTGYVNTSTPITINGTNLSNVDSVTIGVISVTGTIAINPLGTQITGIFAPSSISTPGTYSLVASKSGGITGSTNFTYNYPPPTITGVNPSTGILMGGTSITITGSNFITGATVKVGGTSAVNVVVVDATSITAKTPNGAAGLKDVAVTTAGGTATSLNAFTYTDTILATITGVSPQDGPVAGGTSITINGTNLTGTTNVTVGGTAVTSFSVVNANSIMAVTPAGAAGLAKDIIVTTPINTVTSTGAFTYYGLPGITGVSPSTQTIGSLSNIIITGSNLDSTSSVTIGGVSATIVGTPNSTTVEVIPPSTLTSGLKTILLTTRGGTNTSFSVTYNLSAPTGVTATDGTDNTKVAISWGSVSGASGYDVYISTSKINTSAITGTSYDDTSATPGTTYPYTVKAKDATGSSLFSSADNGWRNTQPITTMTATDGTYTDKVIITWTNPLVTTGITSYSLFRGATEIPSVTSPYNDTAATPGISYTYEVKSVSASGKSLLNIQDTGYISISPPTGLSASDGTYTDKVALAWTVPTTGTVTGFDVYRDTTKITSLAPTITVYNDTTAVEGVSYTYTIKSNSATGDSLASTSNTGWRNIGPPIGTITATTGLLDRITIGWTAVTSATGYNIYRGGTKVNGSLITGTTYDDIHNSSTNILTVENVYSYTIESVTAPGVSATKSTAVTGKRVAIPTTVLTASEGTSTSNVVLNWTDVSAETEYVLYKTNVELFRPVANATTYTDTTGSVGTPFTYEIAVNTAAGLGSRTSATGWKKIAAPALTLTRQENQLTVSWSAVTGVSDYEVFDATSGTSTTTSTTFINSGLSNPNNLYTITVKARYLINSVYYYSDTSSINGYTLIAPPSTAPSASTTDTAKIVVSWNAVSGASTYEVYRNDNYSSVLATVSTTTYNDTAATAGTSYKYKIKSVCTNSTSAFSLESLNGVKPLVVLPPTGVTASYGTYTDKITINWAHAASRDTYTLYYKDSGGVYNLIVSNLTGNTYDHIPPQLLDYYEYYLTTVKSGTESGYSSSDTGCFDTYQQSIKCNIGYMNCPQITDLAASYETSSLNISLKWTPYASSTGLTQYEIIRSRQQGTGGEDGFQTGSCAFTGYISNSVLNVTSINPGNPNWKILPNHTVFEQNQGTNWPASRNTVILSQISVVGAPGGIGTYQLYSCDSSSWQTLTTGSLNFISTLTTSLTQTISVTSPVWTFGVSDTVVDPGYDTYYKIRPYRGTATRKVYGPQSLISRRYIGSTSSYDPYATGGGRRQMVQPLWNGTNYPTGNNNNPATNAINIQYTMANWGLGNIRMDLYRDNTLIVAGSSLAYSSSTKAYSDTTPLDYIPYEYYIKQTSINTGQDQISEKRVGIRGAKPIVTGTTNFYTKIDVSWNSGLSVSGNSVIYVVFRDEIFLDFSYTLSYTDTLGAYCSFSGFIVSDIIDKTKAKLTVTSFSQGVLVLGQYIQHASSGSVIDRGWKVTGVSGSEYTIQNMLGLQRDFSLQSWIAGESLSYDIQYKIRADIMNVNTLKTITLTSSTTTTGEINRQKPPSNVVLTGFTSSNYLTGGPMEVLPTTTPASISLTNIVAAEGCGQTGTIVYIDNQGRMDYTYSSTVATNTAEARDYLKSLWLTGVKCVKLSTNSGGSSTYQYFGVVLSNGKLLMWGTTTQSYTLTTMKNVCGGKNNAVLNTDYTLVGSTSKLYLSNATNYVDIACGGYHAIALFIDGKVYSSAGNTITYTTNALPSAESATTFTKVAAGNFHSIGLRTNGTVVCWGHGATITGSGFLFGQAIVPSGLGTCIDIAAGGYFGTGGHSVAVKSNGDVWAWGNNQAGQCGGAPTTVSPFSKSGVLYYSDGATPVTGVSKVSAGTGSTAVAYTTPLGGYSTGFIGSATAGVLGEVGYGTVSYISCRHYTNILLTPISSLVDIQYWKYYTEITNYNYDTPEIGNKSYKITKTFAHFGNLFTNDSEPIQDYYEGVYKVSVYRYEEKQFSNQTTNVIPLNETIYERTEILYNTYSFENEACPFKDESGTYSSETQCVIGDDLTRVNIDPNIYCRIFFSNNTSSVEFNESNYSTFANTINICNCFENKYLTEGLI